MSPLSNDEGAEGVATRLGDPKRPIAMRFPMRDAYNTKRESSVAAAVPTDLDDALATRLLGGEEGRAGAGVEAIAKWGFGRGFDLYRQYPTDAKAQSDSAALWLQWHAHQMDRGLAPRRFFLFLHFMDAHIPYKVPPELRKKFPVETISGDGKAATRLPRWRPASTSWPSTAAPRSRSTSASSSRSGGSSPPSSRAPSTSTSLPSRRA